MTEKGWVLFPAYDLNPSIEKDELVLNIDSENNALDVNLAKNIGEYFQLLPNEFVVFKSFSLFIWFGYKEYNSPSAKV